jgi:ribosomal protein L11 methyltransferase
VIRLAIRVRREDAEVVLAELLELAPGGVEEVDDGDIVEYAVYGPPGELPELPDVQAAAGGALVEVLTTEITDDWHDRWRSFHRPLIVGGRLHVRPPWSPAPLAADGLIDVVIDPGRAFGTGAHDTTALCLELLLGVPPGRLADLGCGSGVLAIAAAKLGFGPVVALDHDVLAVEATLENARVNDVPLERVERWDARRDPLPDAAVWTANLLRPLLLEVAARLREPGAPEPGYVVASGLLVAEADDVAAAFAASGLVERDRLATNEWAALLLARRPA